MLQIAVWNPGKCGKSVERDQTPVTDKSRKVYIFWKMKISSFRIYILFQTNQELVFGQAPLISCIFPDFRSSSAAWITTRSHIRTIDCNFVGYIEWSMTLLILGIGQDLFIGNLNSKCNTFLTKDEVWQYEMHLTHTLRIQMLLVCATLSNSSYALILLGS